MASLMGELIFFQKRTMSINTDVNRGLIKGKVNHGNCSTYRDPGKEDVYSTVKP